MFINPIIVKGSAEDIANQIKNFTPDEIYHYKQKSANAAKELSAEKEWQKIRKLFGIQDTLA